MINSDLILIVVVGMALSNFALRFIPLATLSRITLPKPIMRWLSFVPVSVMGALFASEVLLPSADYDMPLQNPGIYGALISMLVYKFTQSFVGSTLSGVMSYIAIREIFVRLF